MCAATLARNEFFGHTAGAADLLSGLLARPIGSRVTVAEVAPAPVAAIAPRKPRAARTAPRRESPAPVAATAPAPRRADYEPAQTVSMVLLPSQRAAARREPAPATVAPVAAPAPRRASPAPQAAVPVASRSPRRQKLATVGVGIGRYAFSYAGKQCEVTRTGAAEWMLTIDGRPGSRRYTTKRHAVNAARVYLDSPAPAPVAAPVAQVAAPAPTARPRWWNDASTPKQILLILAMVKVLGNRGELPASPLAAKRGLTKGEASELIDSLKVQLGGFEFAKPQAGPETCNEGPFSRGFCVICGKRQRR